MKPMEIAKNYYAAFDAHDFAKARALMHDRFRFEGPMMSAKSPEELFEGMKAFQCEFKNHLLQMVESGNTVACLFDSVFSKPFRATIRMSEWLTIDGGKIASAVLVYDTAKMPMPTKA
jgi:predicted SnoaL-like aldol condensation-catalyzing enzyme